MRGNLHICSPPRHFHVLGLSPRMRGNLGWVDRRASACTRVYPRACGGTGVMSMATIRFTGLSPRMRGNLRADLDPHALQGSIPAHAGEPLRLSGVFQHAWVYPRACGGTSGWVSSRNSARGLSPRMRGNLGSTYRLRRMNDSGSIPAHAGEPSRSCCASILLWVYPRACGGTGSCDRHHRTIPGLSPRMRGNRLAAPSWRRQRYRGSIPAHAGEPPGHILHAVIRW